ncbi:MAG: tetratricopeptide repeat protein [Acidobacteriota bacterium]
MLPPRRGSHRRPIPWAWVGLLALLSAMVAVAESAPTPPRTARTAMGFEVTAGAAAGYVDDRACAVCHGDLARSYSEVGMARAFAPAADARVIETYAEAPLASMPSHPTAAELGKASYVHEPSGRHYQMLRGDDGGITFRRWQVAADGDPIHLYERRVDWVLGSGHTSRTYLVHDPSGEMYQLPISWYTQDGGHWAMAPGFEAADHLGLGRRVRRECMFCHNAYPEVPAGSDGYGQPHTFPTELPAGIGCQRCHGPGADHVEVAARGDFDNLPATIVNPARLAPELRHQVCYGCHLQPSVALMGVRKFGRDDYSFRPGEWLHDFLVPMDPEAEGQDRSQRFEINHHAYRLEQSACFVASGAQLGCTTCHDPHRKVPPAQRAAHYRRACQTCHQPDACDLERMTGDARAEALAGGIAADDCASCHMPRRRTQDVIHVVMTDHRIQRQPGGPELTAPLEKKVPVLISAELLVPEATPGIDGEIYRTLPVVRSGGVDSAVDHLQGLLTGSSYGAAEPWFDLASGQLRLRRFDDAEASLLEALRRAPDHPQLREWQALASTARGRGDRALGILEPVLRERPGSPEARFNYGLMLLERGDDEAAARELEAAVALSPGRAVAWYHLGKARALLGRWKEAETAYRRALAIDPTHGRAAADLCLVLAGALGDVPDARRVLTHAVRGSGNPEPARAAARRLGLALSSDSKDPADPPKGPSR